MRFLFIAVLAVLPALGNTLTVCTTGCTYPTAQAALNASNNGDTIILTAGENLGPLSIPGNRHDLTIKSSEIDNYPRGYRITRSNPALARLTTVTVGDSAAWGTATPGSDTLTNAPGGAVQAHGLNVGDKVTVGGTMYSAYNCASLNQPPYTDGGCDATRVGYLNIRTNTHLSNGSILYFQGQTLPVPLQTNTPYYIINFVYGGSASNADKFQVSLTPGGSPIFIPQFNPVGQDLVVQVPPSPALIGQTMYVVATPSPTTLKLSPTPGGTPTVWTQIPYGYNGGGYSNGFNITKTSPDYNITFDGIEVSPTTDQGVYYPFYVSSSIASVEGEHHDIRILRCWIHGADDQEDFPMAMLNIAGRNLEIGWNIIENAYSTGNDTQDVSFMSTANVSIHDNEMKGGTETIMSGGNFPWFANQTNTTGISVRRNYLWKPLKAYIGIVATYVSPTQFHFVSRNQGADCSTVSSDPDLGNHCFAYEAQETPGTSTPPSAPVVSRTEWTASMASSTFTATGTQGQKGYIYLLGGVFHMDYNFSGTVSCPSGVVCTYLATPSFPSISTRIGIAIIGTDGDNVFDSDTFYGENRNVWSKNLIESKYGDNWLIEGNVFHRQSNCDGGATCQDPAIQFTVAINGSGASDPVNYLVSSSNSMIRNNIFRMLSAGIVANGKSFIGNIGTTGTVWEFYGFGKNAANRVENNLFMDLGSTEYQAAFDGAIVRMQNTQAFTTQHNTALDARIGFLGTAGNSPSNISANFSSNIVVPYRSSCPGYSGCSTPAATSEIGVQNQVGLPPVAYAGGDGAADWIDAVTLADFDVTSSFNNNLMMNRMGVCCDTARPRFYPNTTWLVEAGDSGRDPNLLFTSWQERNNSLPPNGLNYRAGNYRLAPGQAALYPAYDSQAIGADIDQIEALTGRAGVDVENGWPTFADRTSRSISTGATSAVISYLPNGSSCAIEVWSNAFYSGTPAINTTDSGADVLSGRISVTLSGLSPDTAYYGKRWCGAEVDVFSFTATGSASASGTSTSTTSTTVQLAAPGGTAKCIVEYGATASLGSTTTPVPVSGGRCTVTVPPAAVYWRQSYLSGAGTVVSRGDIQRRGI